MACCRDSFIFTLEIVYAAVQKILQHTRTTFSAIFKALNFAEVEPDIQFHEHF
jgi:hypothetical protein